MKLLSHVQLFASPWTAAYQVPPSMAFSGQEYWTGLPFPSATTVEGGALWPLLFSKLADLLSATLSQHQGMLLPSGSWSGLTHGSRRMRSEDFFLLGGGRLSFSISPSNEYSGLISCRMDWLDLLSVQGTLKCLLQHRVQKHQFFSPQLSL